ncbi:unnamed protein product, partial [Urochloa humidicola]
MLGHRQLHRQVSKDKISAALRKIWERRIVSVRSRQRVMQIWSNSIAEAAMRGDHSQDKLDWDSYERIKSEMISMFLWSKEREQTIKKLKKTAAKIAAKKLEEAGRRAKIAAEKLQAAGRRKVQAAGTKMLKPEKMLLQKTNAQPTQVVVSARPKLKERLTKAKLHTCLKRPVVLKMKSKANGSIQKAGKANDVQGGPNWVLVAGGVLLSTLSVRLGSKLKQIFVTKQQNTSAKGKRRPGACDLHSNLYRFSDQTSCHCYMSGHADGVEVKQAPPSPISKSTEPSNLLVKIPAPESSKENSGVMWSSSPDRLEDPRKPFQYSNCSDSPSVSESGSDIYSKREVIQKLRQQLKRRDEMIMEMQAQIADLKNSLTIQVTQNTNLQSQLDGTNRDLFDSEREVQHLRKVIANHCVAESLSHDKPFQAGQWQSNGTNGHVNG